MRPIDDPAPALATTEEPGRRPASGGHTAPGQAGTPADGVSRTTHPVNSEEDLLAARHAVRAATLETGLGLVDQTRVVTAASELVRNAYIHGGGGTLTLELIQQADRRGLRLTVTDHGPGINDLDAAFTDGYTTGAGLGHGLGGARRLMDEFHVDTAEGQGTTIIATRWKRQV
ncbi:ATP-binding protein [Streptomyces sp. NPDC050856]|uniref:ATP-binding protein n=1 Tax=Streptomyces sp. NPDC050856 TaxID=3154939 RepID=UPI00340C6CC9